MNMHLEHRGTGAPEHRGTGAPGNTSVDTTLEHRSTGAPQLNTATPELSKQLVLSSSPVTLRHCFCLNLCGPSQSGKTHLVKKVLEEEKISPKPERIVYLYKRWQPLYDEMKQTISNIEFIQGIPLNLDDDKFFDRRKVNLIILDDMMSTAANDPKIADLFTEGSHHRSLSVINITQNLFPSGKHSATQRRNTQYMIIFKSPMSEDQIQTLGRFMYPGRVKQFMKIYREATNEPYSYLMIDAKPTTPEHERFRKDLFENEAVPESIKEEQASPLGHLITNRQREHISPVSHIVPDIIKEQQPVAPSHLTSDRQSEHISAENLVSQDISEDMAFSCDDCGLMFENMHDLQRHVKNWCPEGQPPAKKVKLEEEEIPVQSTTEAELPVFKHLMGNAKKEYDNERRRKVEKYIQNGLSEDEAEHKAFMKLKALYMALMLDEYSELINNIILLRKGIIHNQVLETVDKLTKMGYNEKEAIYLAVKQHENHIESLLLSHNDEETSKGKDESPEDGSDSQKESGESENESDEEVPEEDESEVSEGESVVSEEEGQSEVSDGEGSETDESGGI